VSSHEQAPLSAEHEAVADVPILLASALHLSTHGDYTVMFMLKEGCLDLGPVVILKYALSDPHYVCYVARLSEKTYNKIEPEIHEGLVLTVCLAALCEHDSEAIVASDRMITVFPLSQEFEHGTPKIHRIGSRGVLVSAGSALLPSELCERVRSRMQTLANPTTADIVECVKEQFVGLRRRIAEETFLKPRGFTLESFYEIIGRLPTPLAVTIDDNIRENNLQLEILVAGVDDDGKAHIYEIDDPGTSSCFDMLGYGAIGSGEQHAIASLIADAYTGLLPTSEAVYLVYEAKRRAERAPGVGPSTDMCILSRGTYVGIPAEVITRLEGIYSLRIQLDKTNNEQINGLIKELESPIAALRSPGN